MFQTNIQVNGFLPRTFALWSTNSLEFFFFNSVYILINIFQVEAVICPGGTSQCPTGTTCCKLASGAWGCCPFPKVSYRLQDSNPPMYVIVSGGKSKSQFVLFICLFVCCLGSSFVKDTLMKQIFLLKLPLVYLYHKGGMLQWPHPLLSKWLHLQRRTRNLHQRSLDPPMGDKERRSTNWGKSIEVLKLHTF